MLSSWLKKRSYKKAAAEKISNDEYLSRLQRSAICFCGCRHSGDGPFLTLGEIEALMWAELERKSNHSTKG